MDISNECASVESFVHISCYFACLEYYGSLIEVV